MDNKYVKVVYRSEPIGKDKIVLELTTFDYKEYEKDKELKEKKQLLVINAEKNDFENETISRQKLFEIQNYIDRFYSDKYDELMKIIKEQQEKLIWYERHTTIPVIWSNSNNLEVQADFLIENK